MDNKKDLQTQAKLNNEYYKMFYPDLAGSFIEAQGSGKTDRHFMDWVETDYFSGRNVNDVRKSIPFLNKYHQSDAGKSIYGEIESAYKSGGSWLDNEDMVSKIKGMSWNELPHYNPSSARERRRYDPYSAESYNERKMISDFKRSDKGIY
jgi:hypothetical protein